MSNAGLFAVGLVVTVLVLAGMGLVILGAILDGRYEASQRQQEGDIIQSTVAAAQFSTSARKWRKGNAAH
jgi:hypothetical protein